MQWSVEIARRLKYAADRVDAVMITSQGEPLLNLPYLEEVVSLINLVTPNLAHIELQTSGVGLSEKVLDRIYELGIRVISLSIPALDPDAIIDIMQVPARYNYDPLELVRRIKAKGFTLRLSIAMTNWFDDYSLEEIIQLLEDVWSPNQVSFKRLHGADGIVSERYDDFVSEFKSHDDYTQLELLSLGSWKYDARGMGVVWNDDCMVSDEQEKPRYLILQPDGRLYTRWDRKSTVIF